MCFRVPLLKLNTKKTGALFSKGTLGNLEKDLKYECDLDPACRFLNARVFKHYTSAPTGALRGSGDVVSRVISKVSIVMSTYIPPIRVLVIRLTNY